LEAHLLNHPTRLPPFQLTDGGVFPHEAVVAAVYRAPTPSGTLTPAPRSTCSASSWAIGARSPPRVYYRITEKRGGEAVEQVAAHQFDGSGNRIWRETAKILDSERARMRVGQISVPYGICVDPSNVQAGGGACASRYGWPTGVRPSRRRGSSTANRSRALRPSA
jgi:hypothetical protein